MTVQETYNNAKAPFQTLESYWNLAGKLAIDKFKALNETEIQSFFVFLAQIHKEKSSTYQFFAKNQADIQAGKCVLPENRLKALISVMPKFLDTADQVTLLRYELLNHLQNNKIAITRKFTLVCSVQGAFDLYSKFLAVIYYMGSAPALWFSELAYEPQDRRDLILALMYIQLLKLKASVSHFKKDILLVSQKARNLSKSMTYFIDFLGIEVKVVGKDYDLERLNVYDEVHLPTFAGKFTPFLNQYMTDELANEDYQVVLREMQEAVLAHDLGKAIQHYKNHNTLTSRADINFALRGGAGIVRLDIRSWINRFLVGDFKWWEIALPLLVVSGSIVWFTSNIFPLSILFFVLPAIFGSQGTDLTAEEQVRQEAKSLDLAYLRNPYEKEYNTLINEKKAEKGYILLNQHILDGMRENLFQLCLEKATENKYHIHLTPTITQNVYAIFINVLKIANPSYLTLPAHFEGNEQDIAECFEAVRYILHLQLIDSNCNFTILMNLLIHQRAEARYFNYFLGIECKIFADFYERTGDGFLGIFNESQASNYLQHKYKILPPYLLPEPVGKYAELINAWIAQEKGLLKDREQDVASETQKVTQYLSFLEQCHTTPHLNPQPFLLEGSEGILLV